MKNIDNFYEKCFYTTSVLIMFSRILTYTFVKLIISFVSITLLSLIGIKARRDGAGTMEILNLGFPVLMVMNVVGEEMIFRILPLSIALIWKVREWLLWCLVIATSMAFVNV